MLSVFLSILPVFCQCLCTSAQSIQVTVPPSPPIKNVVYSNFLGISFELSFTDHYFGNDTSQIPQPIVNYLQGIRSLTGLMRPVRIRIGGNSVDSSTFISSQGPPVVQIVGPPRTGIASNNQPVNYGPELFKLLKTASQHARGLQYLIGLNLLEPTNPNNSNVPILAGAAQQLLGDDLEAFLLGNEPDLYTPHQARPNLRNYTVQNYISEFANASVLLTNTSAGNITALSNLAGPTICCHWDLATLLQEGYLSHFDHFLKYITVQHYPQNNCFGSHLFQVDYYMNHSEVISLASWQNPLNVISIMNASAVHPKLIMSEFNSASCGGVPNVSDTFTVGSLWVVDYALQLASLGYTAAYVHTRERGVSYNVFEYPEGPAGSAGPWTTLPPYYALLALSEALQSENGSIVMDLHVGNSTTNNSTTAAAYVVYHAINATVNRMILFNYANGTSSQFSLPANIFPGFTKTSVTVKYLAAPNALEKFAITWGGKTLANVGDGKLMSSTAPGTAVNQRLNCSSGCTVNVSGPGMALVFVGGIANDAAHVNVLGSLMASIVTTFCYFVVVFVIWD